MVYIAFLLNPLLTKETQWGEALSFLTSPIRLSTGNTWKGSTVPAPVPTLTTGSIDSLEADVIADHNASVETTGTGYEDWELENMEISWGELENFQILESLGRWPCRAGLTSLRTNTDLCCRSRLICRSVSCNRSSKQSKLCHQNAQTDCKTESDERNQDPPGSCWRSKHSHIS